LLPCSATETTGELEYTEASLLHKLLRIHFRELDLCDQAALFVFPTTGGAGRAHFGSSHTVLA